jgi:hypothetical protein
MEGRVKSKTCTNIEVIIINENTQLLFLILVGTVTMAACSQGHNVWWKEHDLTIRKG